MRALNTGSRVWEEKPARTHTSEHGQEGGVEGMRGWVEWRDGSKRGELKIAGIDPTLKLI